MPSSNELLHVASDLLMSELFLSSFGKTQYVNKLCLNNAKIKRKKYD